MKLTTAWLGRGGPLFAALLAAAVSLPGLRLPFLSDDWAQVEAVAGGIPYHTPFGDFRPLYMASLWLDRNLWGLAPAGFHATNLLLIAATAALVLVVLLRYTGDARLAGAATLLFLLHPYHVEAAAWIGARSDPLAVVPFLLAILAYDRWRGRARGLPVATLLLFEAALLAKETTVTLPLLLLVPGLLDRSRRPDRAEWLRGYLPLALLAAAHFLVRTWALGGLGRTLGGFFGMGWLKNGLGLAAASVLPLDAEYLTWRPVLWGTVATMVTVILLLLARMRSGAIPPLAWVAVPAFVVLIAPFLVGFHERYLFLPAAASALFLVSLVRAARGMLAAGLFVLIAAGWLAGSIGQWRDWYEASRASERLVADLAEVARETGVDEIVLANMPYRVAGASVAGNFRDALALTGHRPVPVRAVAYVSYATAGDRALDGLRSLDLSSKPPHAKVRLHIDEGPFRHFVGPRPNAGERELTTPDGMLFFEGDETVRVRIATSPSGGRRAFVWNEGRLERLF